MYYYALAEVKKDVYLPVIYSSRKSRDDDVKHPLALSVKPVTSYVARKYMAAILIAGNYTDMRSNDMNALEFVHEHLRIQDYLALKPSILARIYMSMNTQDIISTIEEVNKAQLTAEAVKAVMG